MGMLGEHKFAQHPHIFPYIPAIPREPINKEIFE